MTSSMTSQNDLKVVSLYSFMNEKITFFMITEDITEDIIFKLNALMYHWIVNRPLQTIVDCFIDDVIGSQNRSKLWAPIALSIFELEHRSKTQNVTNAHGYLCGVFKFRYHFRQKNSLRWRPFWKCPNIKHSFNLTSEMKRSSQIMQENFFHSDDVIDDVTEWPQSRFSIFLYEW